MHAFNYLYNLSSCVHRMEFCHWSNLPKIDEIKGLRPCIFLRAKLSLVCPLSKLKYAFSSSNIVLRFEFLTGRNLPKLTSCIIMHVSNYLVIYCIPTVTIAVCHAIEYHNIPIGMSEGGVH